MKLNDVLRYSLITLACLAVLSPMASAISNPSQMSNIPLAYNGPESLWLEAYASTGTLLFPMGGGTAPGTVTIYTDYTLNQGRVLTIEAGFNSPYALTDGNGNNILSSAISATFSIDGGNVFNNGSPCNNNGSGATQIFSDSCGYITYDPVGLGQTSATHTDTLTLSLNPIGAPAGSYTGVLYISAQAN